MKNRKWIIILINNILFWSFMNLLLYHKSYSLSVVIKTRLTFKSLYISSIFKSSAIEKRPDSIDFIYFNRYDLLFTNDNYRKEESSKGAI
jgi:hypothetical protein